MYLSRYRRLFNPTGISGPYWEVGTGFGFGWSAGIRAAAIPVQVEIGAQKRAGPLLLRAGVRERFVGLVGTGSPPWDAFNSVQVVIGLGPVTR